MVAEAILRKMSRKYPGSSRRQCFSGSIRGSCGCFHGSYAEGFAEARLYLQQIASGDCPVRGSFFATLHAPTLCLAFQKIYVYMFFLRKMQAPKLGASVHAGFFVAAGGQRPWPLARPALLQKHKDEIVCSRCWYSMFLQKLLNKFVVSGLRFFRSFRACRQPSCNMCRSQVRCGLGALTVPTCGC